MSLLEVRGLRVTFTARDLRNRVHVAHALNGVDFDVDAGEILGLVGESGAGKSLTAQAVLGLLVPPARVAGGTARFEGKDLLALDEKVLGRLRGSAIGMVVQSPKTALDPLARIGAQLVRMQRQHGTGAGAGAEARACVALAEVGIADPARVMSAWPHELSGGMAQRVLIALALINGPRLLVADEPTTGLDVTVQAQVLDGLRAQVLAHGLAAILITHDLGVIAHYCTRVAVMFAGTIVEHGGVSELFAAPAHPYTRALLASTPRRIAREGFAQSASTPPNLYALPDGCLYRDRCPMRREVCATAPPDVPVAPGHAARCHFAGAPP
jgi:oligopeptide/dipeptide ABC transporter ATP-binding protein